MRTIREFREAKGMSPVDLAAALGVSLATVYNWESEKHEPRASQLRKLARLFQVSMDDIRIPGEKGDGPGSTEAVGDASPLRRK